jgi:hypothetical protein
MNIKRFKQTQKFRVIIWGYAGRARADGTCHTLTARQIRWGVGGLSICNAATQKALDALEYTRSGDGIWDQCASGIAGTWEGMNVQLDMI